MKLINYLKHFAYKLYYKETKPMVILITMVYFIYILNGYTQKPVCKASQRKQIISFTHKKPQLRM